VGLAWSGAALISREGKLVGVGGKLLSKIPWGKLGEVLEKIPWGKIIPFGKKLAEASGPIFLKINEFVARMSLKFLEALATHFPKISTWFGEQLILLPVRLGDVGRLLARKDPPTAVFAASDEMAVGALLAARAAGLRVPADLAVVGFDDIEVASLVDPALTTVAQDKPGFGVAAAKAIMAMITGAAREDPVVLPTRLVVRDSCGA